MIYFVGILVSDDRSNEGNIRKITHTEWLILGGDILRQRFHDPKAYQFPYDD